MIQFGGKTYGIRSGNNCPRNLYLVPWDTFTAPGYHGQRDSELDTLAGQVDGDEQAALIVAAAAGQALPPTGGLDLPWSLDDRYNRLLLTANGIPFGWLYEDVAVQVIAAVNSRHNGGWLLPDLEAKLNQYEAAWETADRAEDTKKIAVYHARRFVNWLGGTFHPGEGR